MSTGYLINGEDIENVFESFSVEEQTACQVNSSALGESSCFMVGGTSIKTGLGKVFPTSAGNYIGGANSCGSFMVNGVPVDVALKGCRPIGLPLMEITSASTKYVNRVNGQTWVCDTPSVAQGTRLSHDPKVLFVELQGGGGGGAGSGLTGCSGGGGAGGYAFKAIELQEGDYIKIVVGNGGAAGGQDANGGGGEASVIYASSGQAVVTCYGGAGGNARSDKSADGGSAVGGDVNVTGGSGGGKESSGVGINGFEITLPKPENTIWVKTSVGGGASGGNNYGGGGGASVFAKGADGNSRETPSAPGSQGSGGAGAGFQSFKQSAGTAGGCGICKLYY